MASHRFNFSFCDLNMYVPEGAILDRIRYVQYHFRDRISFNTRTLSLKAAALTSKKNKGLLIAVVNRVFYPFVSLHVNK